jgi:hypothetical protein
MTFIDCRWINLIRLDADLSQEIEPPRRGGSKDD